MRYGRFVLMLRLLNKKLRRGTVVVLISGVLFAYGTAVIHYLVIPHVTCTEHGHVVHAEHSESESETSDMARWTLIDLSHAHEVCPLGVLTSKKVFPSGGFILQTLFADSPVVATGGSELIGISFPLFKLAPKQSPPFSA